MGNILSETDEILSEADEILSEANEILRLSEENLRIELYKWSSAEFPEEYALTYTSLTDKSKFKIFRLSVNRERVLCRLADFLCHDHPVRLHTEIIAERDDGRFNFGVVRVVANGTSERQSLPIPYREGGVFTYECDKRICRYTVQRKGEASGTTINWEVGHMYLTTLKTSFRYYVNIECDKVKGLSAKFRGPFKFNNFVSLLSSEPSEEEPDSLIQRQVNGKPPIYVNSFIETMFKGKQYILLKQGKGISLTEASGDGIRVIVNTGAIFVGHGNGGFNTNLA